jgi:hypothetical protein
MQITPCVELCGIYAWWRVQDRDRCCYLVHASAAADGAAIKVSWTIHNLWHHRPVQATGKRGQQIIAAIKAHGAASRKPPTQ